MAKYKLLVKKSVAKDLRSIPNKDVAPILQLIETLQDDPRPRDCTKLSGLERYRVRQGVYRILYEIADDALIVTVVKVAHRSKAYKRN